MQKNKETNKENSWLTQSQISFALCASEISSLRSLDSEWWLTQSQISFALCASEISSLRSLDSEWVLTQSQISFALCASEISSLRSLDSEWVLTQSPLKNNVSRDFLLLYAIAVTQASLRPALAYKSPSR